jgi:hypothetical protein
MPGEALNALKEKGLSVREWAAAATAVIVAIAILWALWWQLPKRQANRLRFQIRDAKARADVEDSYRKAIAQLIAGAAVLGGAWFAYSGTQQTIEASREATRQTVEVSRHLPSIGRQARPASPLRLGTVLLLSAPWASPTPRAPVGP